MLSYLVILALLNEGALIALAFRSRVSQSELTRLRAHRVRIVRDLRGVSLSHRCRS